MHIPSLRAYDTPTLSTCLTSRVHSRQEPIKGSDRARKGVARWVAGVLVGAFCLSGAETTMANNMPNKSLRILANKQLTDKQYQCHNQIVHRESSWNIRAVNGSHHGYYQMRTESMKNKPYDYQFYIYWYYVSKRYGLDHEIPDYCKALHHLKTRGWQ
jgi:beta-xylosidase